MPQFTIKVIILIIVQMVFVEQFMCSLVPGHTQLTQESIERLNKIGKIVKGELSHERDPCTDYFGFVCTNHNATKLSQEDRKDIGDILENYLHNTEKLSKAEEKLKEYITTCKKYKDDDVKKFIRDFNLPESIGGWPVFESNWKADKFDWKTSMAELETYSTSVIVNHRFFVGPKTSTVRLLVGVEDFDLTESGYKKNKLLILMSMLEIEKFDEVISDAMQFEEECRKIVYADKSEEERIEETNFAGLKQKIPEIDWDKHMEIVTGDKLKDDFSVVIDGVNVLRKVIQKVSTLDPKIVANYFFCNFVYRLPSVCEDDQCGQCIVNAVDHFYSVVSGIFMKKYFTGNTNIMLSGMIKSVAQTLQDLPHILEEPVIGNSTENIESLINEKLLLYFSDENLNKEYDGVEIDSSSILRTRYSLRQNNKHHRIENLLKEKNDRLNILTYLLSWVLSSNLHLASNQPSFVAYTAITLEPMREYLGMVGSKAINKSVIECISEQLNLVGFHDREILSLIAAKIVAKGYFDWARDNEEILQAEDEILKEYDLTSRKMFFIALVQHSCGFEDPATAKRVSSFFWSMDHFVNTFNCPADSTINLVKKCEI